MPNYIIKTNFNHQDWRANHPDLPWLGSSRESDFQWELWNNAMRGKQQHHVCTVLPCYKHVRSRKALIWPTCCFKLSDNNSHPFNWSVVFRQFCKLALVGLKTHKICSAATALAQWCTSWFVKIVATGSNPWCPFKRYHVPVRWCSSWGLIPTWGASRSGCSMLLLLVEFAREITSHQPWE